MPTGAARGRHGRRPARARPGRAGACGASWPLRRPSSPSAGSGSARASSMPRRSPGHREPAGERREASTRRSSSTAQRQPRTTRRGGPTAAGSRRRARGRRRPSAGRRGSVRDGGAGRAPGTPGHTERVTGPPAPPGRAPGIRRLAAGAGATSWSTSGRPSCGVAVGEGLAQLGAATVDARAHGAELDAQGRGDLLVGQALDVAEHDGRPEVRATARRARAGRRRRSGSRRTPPRGRPHAWAAGPRDSSESASKRMRCLRRILSRKTLVVMRCSQPSKVPGW